MGGGEILCQRKMRKGVVFFFFDGLRFFCPDLSGRENDFKSEVISPLKGGAKGENEKSSAQAYRLLGRSREEFPGDLFPELTTWEFCKYKFDY